MSPPGAYRIGVLAGDGIGPEIVAAAQAVLEAATVDAAPVLEWLPLPMGHEAIAEHGSPLPQHVLEALVDCDGWLMGPHDSASYPEPHRRRLNPSGVVRRRFDLYANIRPARTFGATSRHADAADLIVVRENTEGFYADRNTYAGSGEWMPTPDVAIAHGVFTRSAIVRIAHVACRLAAERRCRLTIVHKANVLPLTSGLFLEVCRTVAAGYPGLEIDDQHMDAMTVHLLRRPGDFDVIVTENMFGDILSDLAGEICGSLGLACSLNSGDDRAMAQAAHGSAPELAGRDVANPAGMILSAGQLLGWLGRRHDDDRLQAAAERVAAAVEETITLRGATRDLDGSLGTAEFATVVAELASTPTGARP